MVDVSDNGKNVRKLIEDLGVNPNDPEKWYVLGEAYLSLNEGGEAEQAFNRCLKLDKNHAFALGKLGWLYILWGKNKKAIKHLEKSVKLEPGNFEFWSSLGLAYFQRGKYDDAVEAFGHCLAVNPQHHHSVLD